MRTPEQKLCYSNRSAGRVSAMLLAAAVVMMTGLAACDIVNTDDSDGTGKINFHITNINNESGFPPGQNHIQNDDADTEGNHQPSKGLEGLEEVNIDVQELKVLFAESSSDTVTVNDTVRVDTTVGDAGWVDVPIEPQEINLMELTDAEALLAEAELGEGYYAEIRLVLGNDNSVVLDGETHSLFVPSGSASGYKIKLEERLHSGEIMDLVIAFNAENSVHVTGNGRYMLRPVLRVFTSSQ